MPDYRIFHMSDQGHIEDAAVIACSSNDELKDFILHHLVPDRNIEVWNGTEMIYKSPGLLLHRRQAAPLVSRSGLKNPDDIPPPP